MFSRLLLVLVVGAVLLAILLNTDDFNEESLRGKRVLVTGASRGIGEQIAFEYARYGASVVVTARREAVLQKVVERCRQLGEKTQQFHYIAGDMADKTFYTHLVEGAAQKLGGLDYVVVNHYAESPVGLWEGTAANLSLIETMYDVNALSFIHIASLATPLLEKTAGQLVIVSSILGKVSQAYDVAYSSTKFAVTGFFQGYRHELALKGSKVGVTLCTLGLISTDTAISKLTGTPLSNVLNIVTPGSPEQAAVAIVKGSASRHREVFYPYMEAKYGPIAATLFPQTIEYLDSFIYS